jgi:hypothetical protein
LTTGTPLHTAHSRVATAISAVCVALDLSILLVLAAVVVIIVTGGGLVHVLGVSVRARGVENPIWLLTGLMVLRYVTRQWPSLGTRRWPVDSLLKRGAGLVSERLPTEAMRRLRRPLAGILYLTIAVFLMKVLLAATSPGFFSGDDVEIHEMTLGVLLRKPWPAWDLRCAFFPMVFVYPAQRLALALGASSPEMLVLAGRVAVALVSSAAIPLTWWTARRLAPADPRLAAVSVLLLAINKLQMSFGSSELPRPVSTVFVLAAFFCVIRGGVLQSALGGVFLGVAVAFRFSEVVFVPAALVTIRREQWWTQAVTLLIAAVLTAAAIIGVADALYWGHPFSSLIAAVDYTVVQRESSRGYEPPWEYLKIVPTWSTFVFVALAVAGSSRRTPESWWLWVPVAVLSLLPHKESRYLLPVVPFLCITAARGFLRLSQWLRQSAEIVGWQRWAKDLAAPLFLLAVLHDLGGWRLSRSNEGIRLAEYIRAAGGSGIAGQDLWRLGGRTYLWPLEPIVDVHPDLLADRTRLATAVRDAKWVALRHRVARTVGDSTMHALGFERDPQWDGEDYVLYVRGR